jgi:hypothetical protein
VRAKSTKKEEKIVTPKRTSPSRNHAHPVRRSDRATKRSRRRVWDVGEDAADNGNPVSDSTTASEDSPQPGPTTLRA